MVALILAPAALASKKYDASLKYSIKNNTIEFATPKRVAGQKSVLGLRIAPIDTVHIAFIGLGMRGSTAVSRYMNIEGVKVVALCDLYPERIKEAQKTLKDNNRQPAAEYSGQEGWKQMCQRSDIDLVYICTPWLLHTPMAVYAMEHGKNVAVEVPCATSIKECWDLVNTAEKYQRHCMMLENCCYDFFEMTTLNMAQHGVFGDILHVEGSYIHNLETVWDEYQGNWRLDFDYKNRGDVYPTHGMGPACQLLGIHRGDKMNTLVSMDTKSFNGIKIANKKMGVNTFANGDHTITLIRTEKEKLIEIQHDVYAQRPYTRMYQLTGTLGFANKYPQEQYALKNGDFLKDIVPNADKITPEVFLTDSVKNALMEKYKPELVRELEAKAKKVGGHGGMDFIMDYRLIYCLHNGLPLDEDVYDGAEWSCLGELSRASLYNGSIPVIVPDFTRGDWNKTHGIKYATK